RATYRSRRSPSRGRAPTAASRPARGSGAATAGARPPTSKAAAINRQLFLMTPSAIRLVIDGKADLATHLGLAVVARAALLAGFHLGHGERTRLALLHLEDLRVAGGALLGELLVLLVAERDGAGAVLSSREREVGRYLGLRHPRDGGESHPAHHPDPGHAQPHPHPPPPPPPRPH